MTVSDNALQAEGLGDFSKNLGKKGLIVPKKVEKAILKNPGRAMELGEIVVSAIATKSPKANLSTLNEALSFYHTGEGL